MYYQFLCEQHFIEFFWFIYEIIFRKKYFEIVFNIQLKKLHIYGKVYNNLFYLINFMDNKSFVFMYETNCDSYELPKNV